MAQKLINWMLPATSSGEGRPPSFLKKPYQSKKRSFVMKTFLNQLGLLPIRIIFGISFLFYGLPKLFDPQTHGLIVDLLTQIGYQRRIW